MKHVNPDDAPSLFDVAPVYVKPVYAPRASLDERFAAFHLANGWVLTALHRLALDLLNHGQTRFGISLLYERLRWQLLRDGSLGDDTRTLKLNNDFRSRYSRLLMDADPRLAGVFELRELRSAS